METLPIDAVLPAIVAAVREHGGAVVRAETGAGKTTRVPPALLAALAEPDGSAAGDGGDGETGRLVLVEPRRVAVRAAARRIAAERGWRTGREIGWRIRFERRESAATRLLVVTDGVLLRMLQADPFLSGVATVVFDEVHERSLAAELALAMARRVELEVRPDLALVAMSATFDVEPFARFLGGVPVVESEGRPHPVERRYLGGAASALEARHGVGTASPAPRPREIAEAAARGVSRALSETEGGVLCFLPGVGEIERTAELLEPRVDPAHVRLLRLHGSLPGAEQDAALEPPHPGEPRKVVLATNVAETSLTVPGVSAVVDTGWQRRMGFDPASGLDRLELARISRASADQRAGRAGREGPGVVYRLWSEHEERGMAAVETPEIARVDLAAPALELAAWGETDLVAFPWLEPPDPAALAAAVELLVLLDALETGSRPDSLALTPHGRDLARLPLHPRLAALLVHGRRLGVAREAALAAAVLSERDPFRRGRPGGAGYRGPATSRSDLLDRIEALETFDAGRYSGDPRLSPGDARRVLAVRDQLLGILGRTGREDGEEAAGSPRPLPRDEALGRALLAAFPDRLARRRPSGRADEDRGVLVGGRGVRLGRESAVRGAELFVCLDLDAGGALPGGEARVRLASAVEPAWLPEERLSEEVEVEIGEGDAGRVRAFARRRFADLVLDEREVPVPAGRAEEALVEAAKEDLPAALGLDRPEVATLLSRLVCLAAWMPELELPEIGEETLVELLPALAAGRRSLAELARAPVAEMLRGTLGHPAAEALDRHAPERIEVPSGSRVRLAWPEPAAAPEPPVLAVRIQEMFGLAETPAVAGGRVRVVLHLLAPNHRPQQVTRDLAGFWERTYPEVRRELAGRYPKHAWPEDPLAAEPESRPRRRRR